MPFKVDKLSPFFIALTIRFLSSIILTIGLFAFVSLSDFFVGDINSVCDIQI